MSSINPTTPSPAEKPTPSTNVAQPMTSEGAGAKGHVWGNMSFTPEQWRMFMKIIEKNVSLQIKKQNDEWKRTNQRLRQMWSGNQ